MLRQFLIAFVQNHFVTGVFADGGSAIVGNQQTWNAAEVVECVNMAEQPVLRLHIAANLSVSVPAARQNGNEYVSRLHLSGNRISDVERIYRPVHLNGVAGLVRDAHGRFRNAAQRRYFSQYCVYIYGIPPEGEP